MNARAVTRRFIWRDIKEGTMSDVKMVGREIYEERDDGNLFIVMYFTGGGRLGHMFSYMDREAWDDWEAGLSDWTDLYVSEMEEELNDGPNH